VAIFADTRGEGDSTMAHSVQGAGKSAEAESQAAGAKQVAAKTQAPKQAQQDSVKISAAGQAASAQSKTSEKLTKP
jgi:hypothetical protein